MNNNPQPSKAVRTMRKDQLIAAITAKQDQDLANGAEWWKEHSEVVRLMLWDAIQNVCESDDVLLQLVGRMAQIGMTQVSIEAEKESHHA